MPLEDRKASGSRFEPDLSRLELLDFDDARRIWHKEGAIAPSFKEDNRRPHVPDASGNNENMKPARKTKIFNKFLIFVLPLVILSITITAAVLTWINYDHFRKTIAIDYQNILNSSAGEIGTYMSHGIEDLEALAQIMASIKPDPWQREIALSAFHHTHDRYLSVSMLSRDGKIMASTGWGDNQWSNGKPKLIEQALAGESSVSEVQRTKEQLPVVLMAVPVKTLGEVKAVLCAVLNLKHVWDILEGITIGQSGQVFIMDLSGHYLAHRSIDKVLTQPTDNMANIVKKIQGAEQPVSWFENSGGITYYSLGVLIPRLDWVVSLRQPTREIYYYLFRNISLAAMITLAICIMAVMLGWLRIKKFLAPIHSLHHQVRKIGSGDLKQRVAVNATDEISELGEAFNEMTQALQEKIRKEINAAQALAHAQDLAVLGVTASEVTHEVGNLLNNVGITATALQYESLSPRGEEALAKMEKESARVKTFIRSFLQFAKPPELKLKPSALDLILREVLAMHDPAVKEQGIIVSFDWPDNAPKVPADTQLLYQAFNNLMKNSIEAMPDAGTLTIAGEICKEHITVTFQDSGAGIAPGDLNRIFEPFFTTKGKRGTGLGMAIVKSTVTAHRGTITCQSAPGKGTCFEIKLPLH